MQLREWGCVELVYIVDDHDTLFPEGEGNIFDCAVNELDGCGFGS